MPTYRAHAYRQLAKERMRALNVKPLMATGTDCRTSFRTAEPSRTEPNTSESMPTMALASERTPVGSQQVGAEILSEH